MSAQARVKAGAIFLDEVKPGWFNEIDTDILDMATCENCILGQLYFDYFDFIKNEFPRNIGETKEEWNERTYSFSFSRGFCGIDNPTGSDEIYMNNTEYFDRLKQHWIEEIQIRFDPLG